jgi:orotidine-5'-phosphate decarboxylase
LSILVEDQLPDFIQSDYGMFVTFIKAYYEFLEQNNQAQEILQDISKYADIDETTENLVTRFIQNYASDLTVSSSANNRLLIKKIREIYSKKGTEPAYRLLFNVLYRESIDFFYPYDIVLKSSDVQYSCFSSRN